jgi:hypothetical protein
MALVSVDPMLRLVLDPPRAISWSCCTPRRTTTPRPRPFCWSDSATTGCSCSSRQLGGASGPNAALEHREARAHPGNILLLDWVSYSAAHPGWFQPDRLHLTLAGASAFTDLLASALPYAYVPCPGLVAVATCGAR